VSGPILFIALPMVVAVVSYTLRAWRAAATLLVAGVSLALGLMLVLLPFGEPVTFLGQTFVLGGETSLLGRALVLGPSTRMAMGFLFLVGAGFFLLAWQLEPQTLFAPVGLGMLGLLSGALLIRPLVYAALFLEIAVALSVFPLQADPRAPVRSGLRYLTFFVLALPGLLVSHWLLELYTLTPDQSGLLYMATALIGFSFALLLGLVPFHPWVPAVGRDGAPLMAAFLFTAVGGAVWFLLLTYLQAYPWLTDYPQWAAALTALGVITAVMGGLLGTAQRGAGTLMGYAVMVDTGALLVALGASSHTGLGLGVATLFARAWSLALMAAGLAGLRTQGWELTGLSWRAPWSALAWVIGGLSLIGFPLTAGFAPRWGVYRLLFATDPGAALALLLASTGLCVGLLRVFVQLMTRPAKPVGSGAEEQPAGATPHQVEQPIVVILLIVFIVGTVVWGLFPQLWAGAAVQAGAAFPIFGP